MQTSQQVTVYEPEMRLKMGFFQTLVIMFRNVVGAWDLIFVLFKRDFLMSYKRSFLGMTWLFISPVLGMVSWAFMNATGLLVPGNTGIPYPAYVLLGTSMWGLFHGFYSSASGTLQAGSGFINQVYFPHEILLIKQQLQHLAGFAITMAVNLVVLLAFHVIPSWKSIFFPVVILPLFFLGSAIGLIICLISVVVPDFKRAFDYFFGLLIFVTPIFYATSMSNPVLQTIVHWNPLTYLLGAGRDIIVYGEVYDLQVFLILSVVSFLIFLFSLRLFFVSEQKVIEKML